MLESTRRVDTVVLDKTGTVTTGRMALVEVHVADGVRRSDEALRLAGALEDASEHPIARGDRRGARASGSASCRRSTDRSQNVEGLGVQGVVDGHAVLVGRPALLERWSIAAAADCWPRALADAQARGRTAVAVAWDGAARAVLVVADTVKPTSAEAVAQLRALGLRPVLLTGDNARGRPRGRRRGRHRRTGHVIADVLPADKVDVVKRLQDEGRVVAMVGDGVNDAAALAQADLGLAMGTGTDVAIEAADITLVRGDLRAAADAIRLSRRTLRTIKGNLFWAFAYNVAALPLAAAGLLNPMIAGAAMAVELGVRGREQPAAAAVPRGVLTRPAARGERTQRWVVSAHSVLACAVAGRGVVHPAPPGQLQAHDVQHDVRGLVEQAATAAGWSPPPRPAGTWWPPGTQHDVGVRGASGEPGSVVTACTVAPTVDGLFGDADGAAGGARTGDPDHDGRPDATAGVVVSPITCTGSPRCISRIANALAMNPDRPSPVTNTRAAAFSRSASAPQSSSLGATPSISRTVSSRSPAVTVSRSAVVHVSVRCSRSGRGAQFPHGGHGVVGLGDGRPDDHPHVGHSRERGQVGSGRARRRAPAGGRRPTGRAGRPGAGPTPGRPCRRARPARRRRQPRGQHGPAGRRQLHQVDDHLPPGSAAIRTAMSRVTSAASPSTVTEPAPASEARANS